MKFYDSVNNRLVFIREKATPEFWDHHWHTEDFRAYITSFKTDSLFIPSVKRYLPTGSIILDGGCGRGQLVYALQNQGYRCIGVDFAKKTVQAINFAIPELHVIEGDVRSLEIADCELDGYISAGVIEHFLEGYSTIISEMARTIRNEGFLFLSFPYLSPLRRLKIKFRLYPRISGMDMEKLNLEFYQFAYPAKKVQHDLEQLGFRIVRARAKDGLKGFKDEVQFLKPFLQEIYDGKRGGRIVRYLLDSFFSIFAGHMMLLIMEKTGPINTCSNNFF